MKESLLLNEDKVIVIPDSLVDSEEIPKKNCVDNFFKITENNSTIITEIYAGIVNFLTMSYILACNPSILSISGIPIHNTTSATCFATAIATLIAGVFGNIPIGCAPGIGLSAYFTYSVIPLIDDYKIGLLMIFLSGAFVLVMTILRVTPLIIHYIPPFMKMATIVGMGMFLSLVGCTASKLIVSNSDNYESILELGDLTNWKIWLFLTNLLLTTILMINKIHGGMMLSILSTALIYFGVSGNWPESITAYPEFLNPLDILNGENFNNFAHLSVPTILSVMVSFILVLILDVGGVIFAITRMANLTESKNRNKWALLSTSIGTIIASLLGCSPIIVHIESVAGILVGGRTGLTAVVTSLLFGLSIIFSPIFNSLPTCSTASITIFIGALMMKQCKDIEWDNYEIAVPAFLTIIMMPFTFSISYGLFFGIITFIILKITNIRKLLIYLKSRRS